MKKLLSILSLLLISNSAFAGCVPEDKEEVQAAQNFLNKVAKEGLIDRFVLEQKLPDGLKKDFTLKNISKVDSKLVYNVYPIDKSINVISNIGEFRKEVKAELCKNAFSYVVMQKGVSFKYIIESSYSNDFSTIEIQSNDCKSAQIK